MGWCFSTVVLSAAIPWASHYLIGVYAHASDSMSNVYYFYNNGKSCITNELRERTYSDLSVTSSLRDGDLDSCLVLEPLTSTSLHVLLLMNTPYSRLINIRVLGRIEDCSPARELSMFVVENNGLGDLGTTACVTLLSVMPDECVFRCQTKETEFVLLSISPRDGRPEVKLCEINMA